MEETFIENLKYALDIDGRQLQLNDNFRDFEEWDSLGVLNFIAMLDEKYGIQIEGHELKELVTVEDLLNEVNKRTNSN